MKFVRAKYDTRWSRVAHASLEYLITMRDAYQSDPVAVTRQFSQSLQDVQIDNCWKWTHGARLQQTEQRLLKYFKRSGQPEVSVLDLGASDGSTTVSLVAALRRAGSSVTVYLADRDPYLARYKKGPIVEYRAPKGQPVQLRIGPVAWRLPRPDHRWDLFSRVLIDAYMSLRWFRDNMVNTGRISLVTPGVAHEPAIRLIEMDCLEYREDFVASFEAIRASNILNRSAFGDDPDAIMTRGGSCIVDPFGNFLAGPNFEGEAILLTEIDRSQIVRGKYDLDVVGHYARPDIFQLHVDERPKQPVTAHTTGGSG